MKLKIDQLTKQKIITTTICLFICAPTVVNFINVSINLIVPTRFIWDTVLIYGVLIVLVVASLLISIKTIKKDFIVLFFMFACLFVSSYLIFPGNRPYMFSSLTDFSLNGFYRLFLYAIPLYLFLRSIKDYNLLFLYLSYTAKIMVLSGVASYLLYIFIGGFELQYMVFAYDILFGLVFCFYDYFKHRKVFSLILGLVGSVAIVLGGARGPLVCLLLFILLYFVFNAKKNKLRTISLISFFIITLVYVSNNLLVLANKINSFMSQFGMQSRTLDLIIQQEFFNESGRDMIQNTLLQHIWANPLFGHGMFGDRVLTEAISATQQGTYAHNFFIEVLTQYGLILGPIFIAIVLIIIFKGLIGRQEKLYKDLVLLFIPCGLIKLLFSGSYLSEIYFFLLLAASVNAIANKKLNKKIVYKSDNNIEEKNNECIMVS